ncbi:hypothetical protein ACFV0D_23360 [Streptomyces sp. NPDC059556]|uniref:hypothetical protein n=1 Tax=Streptomyces sp. NPDC059556 TaxID=3346863 RepID=UPI0036927A9F
MSVGHGFAGSSIDFEWARMVNDAGSSTTTDATRREEGGRNAPVHNGSYGLIVAAASPSLPRLQQEEANAWAAAERNRIEQAAMREEQRLVDAEAQDAAAMVRRMEIGVGAATTEKQVTAERFVAEAQPGSPKRSTKRKRTRPRTRRGSRRKLPTRRRNENSGRRNGARRRRGTRWRPTGDGRDDRYRGESRSS